MRYSARHTLNARSSNGRTSDSESEYLGSNPSLAANEFMCFVKYKLYFSNKKIKAFLSLVFIIIAIFIYCKEGYSYLSNKEHKTLVPYIIPLPPYDQSILPNDLPPAYLILESQDGFIADRPVDVKLESMAPPSADVTGYEVNLIGAEEYYSPNITSTTSPLDWTKEIQRASASSTANQIIAECEGRTVYLCPKFFGEKSITYHTSGNFPIQVIVSTKTGNPKSYSFNNKISISPPETLLTIESNNLIIGLAWLTVAVPFLITGLSGVLDLLTDKS